MDANLFARLRESMGQMNDILSREREGLNSNIQVKKIRKATGLSQTAFAGLLSVSIHTLRSWEEHRDTPGSSAQRLLRAIESDPHDAITQLGDMPARAGGLRHKANQISARSVHLLVGEDEQD